MPTDQNVHLSFTNTDFVWHGIIPQSTVTTWLLPALGSGNGTTTPTTPPPYANSTASGFSNSTVCSATAIVPSAGSSAAMSLLPVPHTDHVVANGTSSEPDWNR